MWVEWGVAGRLDGLCTKGVEKRVVKGGLGGWARGGGIGREI